MTPPPRVEPTDADPSRRQLARTPPKAESGAPTTSKASGGDKQPFDADTPSPEVVPVYLRRWAGNAASVSRSEAAGRTAGSSPDSASGTLTSSPQDAVAPAAGTTDPLASDPDALADAICHALADALYESTRAVVLAAIRSAQQAPVQREPARPAEATKADAPAPPIEEPAAGPRRDRGDTQAAALGRTRPLRDANAEAWARQLAPRRGSDPSAQSP